MPLGNMLVLLEDFARSNSKSGYPGSERFSLVKRDAEHAF